MKEERQTIEIDSYEPDWESACENCGMTPTVTAFLEGEMVHHTGLCGPCTWGEADMLDPTLWNA